MWLKNKDKCLSPNPDFSIDQACLDISNQFNETVDIYGQYAECHKCDFKFMYQLASNSNTSLLINTKYNMKMHFVHNESIMCDWSQELLEHYRYFWNISEKCAEPVIREASDNSYIPILSAFIILFFFGTIWYMVKCIYKCTKGNTIWKRVMWNSTDIDNDLGSSSTPIVLERPPPVKKHPHRIKSIDVFRGLCIIIMIFCNFGGGEYWFFKHSVWNGLTVADLVFPWFVWIMGFSMSISFNNKLRQAVPRRQIIVHVIKRSILLIILGLIVNSRRNSVLSNIRFMGILQRMGLIYLIVGILEAALATRYPNDNAQFLLPEFLNAWAQWLIMLILIVVHTCVTFLVEVPNCGKGYLGPGGLDEGGKFQNCSGGVAGYIDRAVLGSHIYSDNYAYKFMYETKVNIDPEGILGTLTAAFLLFLGVHAGRILHTYNNVQSKTVRWIICGITLSLLGGILCGFSKEDGPIPINKKIWSLSLVFVLGGAAFIIQACLYILVDITRKWGGRPFFYPGMNPLILYILHSLFRNVIPFGWTPPADTHAAHLGMNLWGTAVWVCISIYMYKKNIIISI